jgi:hypothetical protein
MRRLSVGICLVLYLALPASAQMYKWVDSNGKVQYSDKPPPGNVKTEKLRDPAPAPAASTPATGEDKGGPKKEADKRDAAKAGPKTVAEQEQAFRKRQVDANKAQEEDKKKQAAESDREENCRRAKASLANFEIGGRQTRIDEKGERVFMDEQQIAQETARVKQIAAAACK